MAETSEGGQQRRNNNNRNRQGQGGNRNRRNNNNRNRQGGNRNRQGQGGSNRSGNNNRQGNRKPAAKKQAPPKLTFWQKILSFFGIKPQPQPTAKKKSAPKSNTRVAKGSEQPVAEAKKTQPVPVESPRLYIGNLSYEVTEYDIEDLFKGVGPVKGVEIIYNNHTHKSKGYGFVEMLNVGDAKRAVEVLHDQPFMGRKLVVNGAKTRKPRQPRGEKKPAESTSSES